MPLPRAYAEEMATKRRDAEELAHRDTLWAHVRTALMCVGWSAAGIFLLMWSCHSTNMMYGRVAFFGGIAVGNAGILFTLLAAYVRGEHRGDW
jgi:hypothetical protein